MSDIKIKTVGASDDATFDVIVSEVSQEVKEIAHGLRNLLANVMPNITEVPWVIQKTVGYGVGPKKMSEHFCYIAPLKNHVNLGFFYGADLPDPDGLLEGTGKLLRHIKVKRIDDLGNPAIKNLVIAASVYLPKLK